MIKVVAKSGFHGNLERVFNLPEEDGDYPRRCPNACDNKKVSGIQIHCGCGWPVSRTIWEVPHGWDVWAEWSHGTRENIVVCLRCCA